jgi:hypothetical protein
MKEGNLFCFILFCHAEISQIMMLHATLLVSLESSKWVGVHWLGLRLLEAMVWKLLIIEPFFKWKLNKTETENFIEIWGHSWCSCPWWVRFNRVYFTIFRAKVRKILIFWVHFVAENSNFFAKIGFERKNQLSPQFVHTWANGTGYTSIHLFFVGDSCVYTLHLPPHWRQWNLYFPSQNFALWMFIF